MGGVYLSGARGDPTRLALASLLTGSIVWGLIWYPYRALEDSGIPGAAASVLTYGVALLLALIVYRADLRVRPSWTILGVGLTAGATNVGFVWATIHGEVVRVVLLFYLSPVWTALFARLVLEERIGRRGAALAAVALSGAALMLWDPAHGLPVPRSWAEWIGLLAGMNFALCNVLSRRVARASPDFTARYRSLWVLIGCVLVGAVGSFFDDGFSVAGFVLSDVNRETLAPVIAIVIVLGIVLLLVNQVVQYALEILPANRVPIVCLFEVVVAAASSWLLAGETLGLKALAGGCLIVAAGLFPQPRNPKTDCGAQPALQPVPQRIFDPGSN